ncbi:hypothetical protein OSB04_020290 [Centaurea solstitialis]|uniref:Auxin-responsive protein n=1 Tax=Centaurea solstitialis TaxID=347529 RepID=A0AA38W3Q5_9ASTR|nr:hypothetical protein OSB04_020290 [Centaurea solstitialis]
MDLNYKATELRLGLPGIDESPEINIKSNKRSSPEMCPDESRSTPPAKAQVVGWPPVRSYRKNLLESQGKKKVEVGSYVKVSMDGAPYLRKVDLKVYKNYEELMKGLEEMFKCIIGLYNEKELGYNGSMHAPTYEDKEGDWMLVGDVPWEMFLTSCKRLRIMKANEAKGLNV